MRAKEKVFHVKVFDVSNVDDRGAFKLTFGIKIAVN